jgi:hypothetical protein
MIFRTDGRLTRRGGAHMRCMHHADIGTYSYSCGCRPATATSLAWPNPEGQLGAVAQQVAHARSD